MKNLTEFVIVLILLFWNQGKAWPQNSGKDTLQPCIECKELLNLALPDLRITEAELTGAKIKYCMVRGIIGSEIKFELRLPESWNLRFIMGGGGGFVGSVMNSASGRVNQGYATVGTDTGHEGKNMEGSWALNNIERQVNFGFLAVHRTAEVSKAIIANYYGSKPLYSYFSGCSRGGGQALMEAQRYPNDFNGIICSGPGFDWPGMSLDFIDNYRVQYPAGNTYPDGVLTSEKIKLLEKIILDRYDELDGVKDNIINDPGACPIDYSILKVCSKRMPADECFTKDQITVIKAFYDGVSVNGSVIYPGYPVGSESGWYLPQLATDTSVIELGQKTWFGVFGSEFFKYLVFNDPEWNLYDYNFSNFFWDTKYAASFLNSTSTDYSEFKKNGGKMIINQGWSDPVISAFKTIKYYNDIKTADKETEEYIRLFLLPGGGHCGISDGGPTNIDWLKYLRDWVENGNPPEKVIVSKSEKNKVAMTRPVFPYPSIAVYDGKGYPNDANSFSESKK
jgi:feruloyl esterase